MKIAVIGASGRLGSKIVKRAYQQEFEVKGFYHHKKSSFSCVEMVSKDLFDMSKEDLEDIDVLVRSRHGYSSWQ